MCSIFGYLSKEKVDVQIFQECLRHRGPDGNGVFRDESRNLTLGHSRLAIIDLSDVANQPMIDETENFVLVFNGEIYNYNEIRLKLISEGYRFKTHSDTEVILQGYKHFGRALLPMLRGMFAFVVLDKRKQTLFLARDRFGIKPLFYVKKSGRFAFASEVTPLIRSGFAPAVVSRYALDHYMVYGSVKQPQTVFAEIECLAPASWMEVKIDSLATDSGTYYNFVESALELKLSDIAYSDAVALVREKLEQATSYHLVADVEVGAFLSGGVDSTAVVALMSRITHKPIKTFSVGFKGATEVFDETSLARESAAMLGCEHVDVVIGEDAIPDLFDAFIASLDQPSVDGLNTFIVSKAAARKVKVVLSGLGGDEVFAGYDHFQTILEKSSRNPDAVERLLQMVNRVRANRFTSKYQFIGLPPEESVMEARRILTAKKRNSLLRRPEVSGFNGAHTRQLTTIQRVSAYEVDNYLLDTLLRDSDVMSMAHGLECRPVLLDHELMETAFALPDAFKIKGGTKKAIFIDAVKDIIPEQVYKRKKTGFEMPLLSWMTRPLKNRMKEAFSSDIASQLYEKGYIKSALEAVDTGNVRREYWADLVLLRWMQVSGVSIQS